MLDNLHEPAHSSDAGAGRERAGGGHIQSSGLAGFVKIFDNAPLNLLRPPVAQQKRRQLAERAGIPKEELTDRMLSSTFKNLRFFLKEWI